MRLHPLRSAPAMALLVAAVAACDNGPTEPKVSGPAPTRIEIRPSPVGVGAGDTARVIARDERGEEANRRVRWSSLNPRIATVREGVIRGVAQGSVRIVAERDGVADTADVVVGPPGRYLRLNVNSDDDCDNADVRRALVVDSTQRALVAVDLLNPTSGQFSNQEYREIGIAFDTLIYPVVTGAFGTAREPERNAKVVLLFTKAVNDLTEPGSQSYVGGFFFGRDLFPRRGATAADNCAGSNESELFYMLVPDPTRGGPFTTANVRRGTVATIGHEFEHLINASRRIYVNRAETYEETWLDEGLAHIAEELLFYRTARLQPRSDIGIEQILGSNLVRDAYNGYMLGNDGRYHSYLENPERYGPYQAGDDLAVRGAAWSLLRYLADQRGADQPFFRNVVNSRIAGLRNLAAVLGTDPVPMVRDWATSVYTDNAVPGIGPRLQQPSWNWRSIYGFDRTNRVPGGVQFPLRVRQLGASGTQSFTLGAGSAAFLRFGVAPATRAQLRVTSGGAAPVNGPCVDGGSALTLAVGEASVVPAQAGTHICLEGGAQGGEFVAVPFHGTEAQRATVALEVTGTNLRPVVGPPNPALLPGVPGRLFSLSVDGAPRATRDFAWESALRERERRFFESRGVLRRGRVPTLNRSAAAIEQVSVTIVRTR